MSIRKLNDEGTKWVIDYYPCGQKGRRKRKVFLGIEKEAQMAEIELRRNNHPLVNHINPKISDIIPEYLEWLKLNRSNRTYEDVKLSLKKFLPILGKYQVSSISPVVIRQFQKTRKEHPRSCNKELTYLSGVINFMVKNNYSNPLAFKIEKLPYHKPIPQIPHPSEIIKLIESIDNPIKKCMIMLRA